MSDEAEVRALIAEARHMATHVKRAALRGEPVPFSTSDLSDVLESLADALEAAHAEQDDDPEPWKNGLGERVATLDELPYDEKIWFEWSPRRRGTPATVEEVMQIIEAPVNYDRDPDSAGWVLNARAAAMLVQKRFIVLNRISQESQTGDNRD